MWHPNIYLDIRSCPFYDIRSSLAGCCGLSRLCLSIVQIQIQNNKSGTLGISAVFHPNLENSPQ